MAGAPIEEVMTRAVAGRGIATNNGPAWYRTVLAEAATGSRAGTSHSASQATTQR